MHLFLLILAFAAFACLALSMQRHQEDIFGVCASAAITRGLRAAGWLLMLLSLFVALRQPDFGFGLVSWFGHIMLAANSVFLLLLAYGRFKALAQSGTASDTKAPHGRRLTSDCAAPRSQPD